MRVFTVGSLITLRGKTLKGKNRIRQFSSNWIIKEVQKHKLLICPFVDSNADLRWVDLPEDKDFIIEDF